MVDRNQQQNGFPVVLRPTQAALPLFRGPLAFDAFYAGPSPTPSVPRRPVVPTVP